MRFRELLPVIFNGFEFGSWYECTPQWLCDVYSGLCLLLQGAALGSLFVIVLLQYTQQHDISLLYGFLANAPPAPPPFHSPVFTDEELAPLFVLTILLGIFNMVSYVLLLPQKVPRSDCSKCCHRLVNQIR